MGSENQAKKRNFLVTLWRKQQKNRLVVSWCRQLEVQAHYAVGCFIKYCGWNSTVEALSFGVPQFWDQITNAHFVEKFWGVGIKPKINETGDRSAEAIHICIREIMDEERGKEEIKRKAMQWKELAARAVDDGGSSDNSIDEIVSKLVANGEPCCS